MIVQSVILPNNICQDEEIYFRNNGEVTYTQDVIKMGADSNLTTDTYMNCFDAAAWYKYTGITQWKVCLEIQGSGSLRLAQWTRNERHIISQRDFQKQSWEIQQLHFTYGEEQCLYYLDIRALSEVKVKNIRFEAVPEQKKNDVRLGLIICTYHRKEALYKNLDVIRQSLFFDTESKLYGKLQVHIVDNGSELPLVNEEGITLYHNPNTGGSGGFTRGIEEIRKQQKKARLSNVIFMDDDVEFLPETLYRLYSLLALIKDNNRNDVIAGRMFRMDQRNIQYTAAEIWNKGDIQHIGWNRDMTLGEELFRMNENQGAEYGGWWFCCFPIKFVMKNTPLPFFLHCDDVEYGLRHGGTPIILNGIHVWHETYEYRQSPVMVYYDIRNRLIVNAIYYPSVKAETYAAEWETKIRRFDARQDFQSGYMAVRAMYDFLKGPKWFLRHDIGQSHRKLQRYIHFGKNNSNRFVRKTLKRCNCSQISSVILKYKMYLSYFIESNEGIENDNGKGSFTGACDGKYSM